MNDQADGCRQTEWPVAVRVKRPDQATGKKKQEKSDCQTFATLGTTGTQNGTATTGFLANQEAMGSFTTADGGLVGTLHVRQCATIADEVKGKSLH